MFCNPFFDVASIIISIIIIYFYCTSKKTSSTQNRIFIVLNFTNALTAFFDILTYYSTYTKESILLCELFTLLYFFTHVFVIPLIYIYILINIKNWFEYSRLFKVVISIPLIIMIASLVINIFTGFLYSYTQDCVYHRNAGMIIMYLGIVFYMGTILAIMWYYRKMYPAEKNLTILASLGFIFISVVIQLFSEQTRLEPFGISFALLLIFLTIQDPHDELDFETGLYNKQAFEEVMNKVLHSSKDSILIAVYVKGYIELFKNTENKSLNKLITTFLREIDPNIEVFIYSNNLFCIYINKANSTKADSIIEIIENRFKNSWDNGDISIKYSVRLCKLNIPSDVNTLTKINSIFNNIVERNDGKTVLTIDDFDISQLERSLLLNSAINKAIEEDLFELIFSPVYTLKSQKIEHVSISFRFLDNTIGYVSASEIIPVLERQGVLLEVLNIINFKILDFFMSDSFGQLGLKGISIKVTSIMTIHSGALENLCKLFEKYHADSSMITIELSESLVHRTESALETLMPRLARKGFTFLLCEYGAGYSNISAFYDLPFTGISINGNVVRAAFESKKSRVVLKKTLELARKLDMLTILSGIIDPKYFDMLQYFQCDYALGSYFLENLDLNTFKETLRGGLES